MNLALALVLVAAAADDEQMSALNDHHRHHHHGGISQFVEMSLDTLGEKQAKHAKVDQVQEALHACTEPVEDEEEHVLSALAEGVAAGNVDTKKVETAVARLTAAGGAIHTCVAAPLNDLHALLSALERAELGEKVRAHYEVWHHVNVELADDSRDDSGGLAALTRELKLSAEQADKMAAALKALTPAKFDSAGTQGRVVGFVKAFNQDTFDATSVSSHTTADLSTHATLHMAMFYATIAPMLTADQRTTLAAHLNEHAAHHAPGSP